jgi:hypothetical protein
MITPSSVSNDVTFVKTILTLANGHTSLTPGQLMKSFSEAETTPPTSMNVLLAMVLPLVGPRRRLPRSRHLAQRGAPTSPDGRIEDLNL